jgi:hypothetical protein
VDDALLEDDVDWADATVKSELRRFVDMIAKARSQKQRLRCCGMLMSCVESRTFSNSGESSWINRELAKSSSQTGGIALFCACGWKVSFQDFEARQPEPGESRRKGIFWL